MSFRKTGDATHLGHVAIPNEAPTELTPEQKRALSFVGQPVSPDSDPALRELLEAEKLQKHSK